MLSKTVIGAPRADASSPSDSVFGFQMSPPHNNLPFFKMNGCGNDFVVLDGRSRSLDLTPQLCRAIASREEGIGCDQLLILLPSSDGQSDAIMDVYNADGSPSNACGNGARCVALLLGDSRVGAEVTLQAGERRLPCRITGTEEVCVDMGAPDWNPETIPLALPVQDAACLDPMHFTPPMTHAADVIAVGAVSMGNPHCIFFFEEREVWEGIDVEAVGAALERHDAFPQRANISFVHIEAEDSLRLRVWERGAGATLCCGTAACATHALAIRRGLGAPESHAHLPGGSLLLRQRESDGHILMSGHGTLEYEGVFDVTSLRQVA